jgi:NADH-quinone oxidoreductase subunit F
MLRLLKRIDEGMGRREDIDLLANVADNIEGNTICALGDAAALPVKGTVKKFRKEFEARINEENLNLSPKNIVHALR